ncbi:unnamed protein product [Schistosoma bovis]|nr:unnamed protein product [Schistosoma bovis]
MVLGYSYSLDCDSESGKNNFVDLEEFPALTKSKPISFSGVTWKSQVFVPTEDSIESEATGNNCLNVSKKKRLKKKKKKILCSGESTDDSSPAKCCDFCFFVSEEVESTKANQPSFRETHFEFIKSHTKSDTIVTNGDSHLTESSIVEVTNPFQVEDEGFVEELIDYATNHHLVSYSFPTNTSNILSSGSTQHSIQSRPIYESRIISPTCPLNSTKDQMAALGLNHSVSNALKLQTNPIKCPVKEKTLRNVRLTNTEQHARSMSPSNLTDTYLSSKDTNDLIDEDDMEGTDLLHLISNSLDRFNAIVHPRDNISTLTSGLGESRNILSESESSNSYSQDCLFPTDIVAKPTTILSADRECKFSNMMNIGNKLVQKHFNHSSLLILDSEVEQADKLLEINNSSYTTTTTSSSFGRLPISLSYSYSNEVPLASCQPNTTYYSNVPSTIPIDVTVPAVTKYIVPPTDSIQAKNVLTDKSKSCWPTLPVSVTQHNPKVLTSSTESNNLLVELINNNRNVLTDNDIEMLNYLNLDLKNLLCNVSTTNTTNTTLVDSPSLYHSSVNNNKCNSMGLFVNRDENLWNHSKSFQSNMSLMHKTQPLRHPSQSPQTTSLPPLSKIFLQHPNTVSSTPVDVIKYECLNDDSDKLLMNSSDKMIFNTKCINNANNKRNDNFIASFSLTSVNNSTGWSTEAINSLPCDTRNMLARSHSVGYHQETSVTTSLSTIGPGVAMTTSCPINRTPIINVNYPLTTGNLNTNRLPIIGHSTSTSGKNKMTSVSLPLPVCTTNSTVKNLNGSQQQEAFSSAHCRRQNNNNIPSNIGNISVCSVGTFNSVKQAGSNSQSSCNKSRCCTNGQMAPGAVTTITPSDSSLSSLYPGTELVNGKPVVAKWRRACSFYLRGHCKKEDCEFAHDLTKVTCKFWEMGECFKGSTCPFLHGYPPELNIEQQHS